MEKIKIFTLFVVLSSLAFGLNAQNLMTKNVQVTDPFGNPAASLTLYVMDGFSCQQYQTNREGIAKIDVQKEEFVIYAADLSGNNKYGVSAYAPNYSGPNHSFQVPFFPTSQRQAGIQIEGLFETLRLAFDMGSLADLFLAIKNGTDTIIPAQMGVPAVFSVNPIPKKMTDGTNRLGVVISGILVKPLTDIANLLPGNKYVYGHSGSF